MFNRSLIRMIVAFALAWVAAGTASAELSLGELRTKFEAGLVKWEVERDDKVAALRKSYSAALGRLKESLGKEEKLDKAVQVLAEIENVEGGKELPPLPQNADYRLKTLRGKWNKETLEIAQTYKTNVRKLANTYLGVLEDRKRALTRAGKIREALVVEEEHTRVKELEGIKEVRGESIPSNNGEEVEPKDLGEFLEGKTFSYLRRGAEPRKLRLESDGVARYISSTSELVIRWELEKGTRFVMLIFQTHKVELAFSKDGKSFKGRHEDGQDRQGKLLRR